MQSYRDHGTGPNPHKKRKGEGHLGPTVQRDPSSVSTHPVLITLVRLLARQAAAECLAASDGSSPFPENRNDQDIQDSQI